MGGPSDDVSGNGHTWVGDNRGLIGNELELAAVEPRVLELQCQLLHVEGVPLEIHLGAERTLAPECHVKPPVCQLLGFRVELGELDLGAVWVHHLDRRGWVELRIAPAQPKVDVCDVTVRRQGDVLDVVDVHPENHLLGTTVGASVRR
jgi:hypothetical protein